MIRANLLPRPKERVGFAGIDIDAEYLRQCACAIALIAIVTLVGVGIETFRLSHLRAAAESQNAVIAMNAPLRAKIASLALEVARYQNISREAHAFHRSGADVAIAIARIGNSIPANVWLTSLAHESLGYDVVGGANTVDDLGGTMLSLGRALPRSTARLVNIDNRSRSDAVVFTARVDAPTPESAPVR